jgi:NTE family protein
VLPLRITATDLDTGELTIFGVGGRQDCTIPEAVYASMALPVYYPPARIGGRRYADGGLRAVLPLDVAATIPADLVVAVDVGPVLEGPPPHAQPMPALIALQDRALAIALADQKARTLAAWYASPGRPTLALATPAIDPHATFAFDRTAEFIEAGYRATHAALAARRAA